MNLKLFELPQRRMVLWWIACWAVLSWRIADADAQTQVLQPGKQDQGLEQDLGQRQAIRGCPVGDSCQGDVTSGLLEFEREMFPKKRGANPWFTSDPRGHYDVRRQGKKADRNNGGSRRLTGRRGVSPTKLRPDLPWLADLNLPDVPVHWDRRIIAYLEFYRYDPRGRAIMTAWLRDQGKYRSMILKELRQKNLPDSLLYIAMIESSYSPHEYSRVGASGLWQFMPAAGRIYGLRQNRWLDERNDPYRSTVAVTDYFQDLYDRFGNWDLALAAYNTGYGAVIRSIAKYNTNDYWELIEYENGLAWGPSLYVSKFLAAAIVGYNLDKFGYQDVVQEEAIRWDEVEVPRSVPVATVAKAAGVATEVVVDLNPQLRQNRTPPTLHNYVVRVPLGTKSRFALRFPQLQSDWDDVDAYVVRHGERFEDIAAKHGISRSELRKLNGMSSESETRGGMILVVPKVDESTKRANSVQAKEDLYRSGVPKSQGDEPLLVALANPSLRVNGHKRWLYRVVAGDTQEGIAQAFGVNRFDLSRWNQLDPEAHLHPRMILQVWKKTGWKPGKNQVAVLDPRRVRIVRSGSPEHLDEAERRVGRVRRSYSPARPESLEEIGRKFGLGKYDLARINQRAPSTVVEPNETILVYEVADVTRSDRAKQQAKAVRRSIR